MSRALAAAILQAVTRPMSYPEIEAVVGKQSHPLQLGIELTKLALAKRLTRHVPNSQLLNWPVYSPKPTLPRKFSFPRRVVSAEPQR